MILKYRENTRQYIKECTNCGSEFIYNYVDIDAYNRIICPYCKTTNSKASEKWIKEEKRKFDEKAYIKEIKSLQKELNAKRVKREKDDEERMSRLERNYVKSKLEASDTRDECIRLKKKIDNLNSKLRDKDSDVEQKLIDKSRKILECETRIIELENETYALREKLDNVMNYTKGKKGALSKSAIIELAKYKD